MVIMGQLLSRSRGYDIRRAQLAGDPGTSWLVDGDIHALAAQMDILSDNAPLSDAEAAAKSVEASRDIVALYEEDPFPALPDELLALLFRKCEPEAFLAAWQVSRRWRGVASQEAAPLFNAKPRQGIAFLMQTPPFLTPDSVARFLLKGEDLNRQLIGDYLGDRTPRCAEILQAYLHLFDFAGLEFEDALESFLGGFELPVLPHKTKRILGRFGERYVQCNPGGGMGLRAAGELAMCVVELRRVIENQSSMYVQPDMVASKIRFLKWAYPRLSTDFLGHIHDRVLTKFASRRQSP